MGTLYEVRRGGRVVAVYGHRVEAEAVAEALGASVVRVAVGGRV